MALFLSCEFDVDMVIADAAEYNMVQDGDVKQFPVDSHHL